MKFAEENGESYDPDVWQRDIIASVREFVNSVCPSLL